MSLQQQLTQPLSLAGLLLVNSAPFQELTKQRAAKVETEKVAKSDTQIAKQAIKEYNKDGSVENLDVAIKAGEHATEARLKQAQTSGKKEDIETYLEDKKKVQALKNEKERASMTPEEKEAERQAEEYYKKYGGQGEEPEEYEPTSQLEFDFEVMRNRARQHLAIKQQEKRVKKGYISPSVTPYNEMNRYDKHKFVGQLRKGGMI